MSRSKNSPMAAPTPAAYRRPLRLALWAGAAVAAGAVLAVAIAGRDDGSGATLRAMAASEAMPDEQAEQVAANTVRVWVRERNEQNLANLQALSCPDVHDGALANELHAVEKHRDTEPHDIVATPGFTREGSTWTIFGLWPEGGAMFVLKVLDDELRVCQIDSAPVP